MHIDDIKQMSREHLEDLVEYMIRQKETHINVAPHGWDRAEKTAWVRGFDYSRARMLEMAEDHELLKKHLPNRQPYDPLTSLRALADGISAEFEKENDG